LWARSGGGVRRDLHCFAAHLAVLQRAWPVSLNAARCALCYDWVGSSAMGQYFSLHDGEMWERVLTETLEPSIWSNVRHSPLSLSQKILLERPGRVSYEFPHGMRFGSNLIQLSESTNVSLLVGFEEQAGRLFAGVLLTARHEEYPHYYCREIDEVTLSHPNAAATAAFYASDGGTLKPEELEASVAPISPKALGSRTAGRTSPGPEAGTGKMSNADFQTYLLETHAPGAPGRTSPAPQEGGTGLQLDQLFQETPMERSEWRYILFYVVKEGLLVFFSNDMAGCEEVVREIAHSYGTTPPLPQDLPRSQSDGRFSIGSAMSPGPGTQAASNLASALKVKCVEHEVGRAPPGSTKLIADLIKGDLQRRFAVRSEAEQQPGTTNCVVFCLRAMMALQLSVRGYDIRRVCESRPDLGPKAGEAACAAWEQLWRRVRA